MPDGSTEERTRLKVRTWRIPHNLRPIWALGSQLALLHHGHVDQKDAAKNIMNAALSNTNPFGSNHPANMVAPTILDPFVDLYLNRTWTGSPIFPEEQRYTQGTPQSWRAYERRSSDLSEWIVKSLNEATGGSRYVPGDIDLAANGLDHLARFVGGGLGRFVSDGIGAIKDGVANVDTPIRNTPIVRRFASETSYHAASDRFWDVYNDATNEKNRLTAARKVFNSEDESVEAREEGVADDRVFRSNLRREDSRVEGRVRRI